MPDRKNFQLILAVVKIVPCLFLIVHLLFRDFQFASKIAAKRSKNIFNFLTVNQNMNKNIEYLNKYTLQKEKYESEDISSMALRFCGIMQE